MALLLPFFFSLVFLHFAVILGVVLRCLLLFLLDEVLVFFVGCLKRKKMKRLKSETVGVAMGTRRFELRGVFVHNAEMSQNTEEK